MNEILIIICIVGFVGWTFAVERYTWKSAYDEGYFRGSVKTAEDLFRQMQEYEEKPSNKKKVYYLRPVPEQEVKD